MKTNNLLQRNSQVKTQSPPSSTSTTTKTLPRLLNTTVNVPIVYGSIASPLPKVDEYATHKWTLYVRGPNNEDLSNIIAKVVFQLHPSFPQPVRELTAPPFEVTEKGWGEFEATIRIVWRVESDGEKATVLLHGIKLYPPIEDTTVSRSSNNSHGEVLSNDGNKKGKENDKVVVAEVYDEVVFTDPTESFYQQLIKGVGVSGITSSSSALSPSINANDNSTNTNNHNSSTNSDNNSILDITSQIMMPKITSREKIVQENFLTYSDEEHFKILLEAQKFLELELENVKARILRAESHKVELEEAIAVVTAKSKKQSIISSSTATTTGTNANTNTSMGPPLPVGSGNMNNSSSTTYIKNNTTTSGKDITSTPSSSTTTAQSTKKKKSNSSGTSGAKRAKTTKSSSSTTTASASATNTTTTATTATIPIGAITTPTTTMPAVAATTTPAAPVTKTTFSTTSTTS